jgi:hypothetical protein
MRTTLDLDADVLMAARAVAEQENISLGKAISNLIRRGLLTSKGAMQQRNGIPLLPRRKDIVVTMELVNQLRDEE